MIQQPLIIALAFFTGAFAMWAIMLMINIQRGTPQSAHPAHRQTTTTIKRHYYSTQALSHGLKTLNKVIVTELQSGGEASINIGAVLSYQISLKQAPNPRRSVPCEHPAHRRTSITQSVQTRQSRPLEAPMAQLTNRDIPWELPTRPKPKKTGSGFCL